MSHFFATNALFRVFFPGGYFRRRRDKINEPECRSGDVPRVTAGYAILLKAGVYLITVTLCGQPQTLRMLSPDSPLPEAKSASLLRVPPNLTLLCANPGHIRCENAVFVASHPEDLPLSFTGDRCAAILDSSNTSLRAAAAQRRLPALTCGLSGADTFTISSWRGDSAMISLLRPLTAFDGSTVEPFELPVAFERPPEAFALLACAAVFSLLGDKSPLSGLSLWQLAPEIGLGKAFLTGL